MTPKEALDALESADLHVRLQAARVLAQTARPSDAPRLQAALAVEKVVWVKTALRQAIDRIVAADEHRAAVDSDIGEIVPPEVFDQIRTIAIGETTRRIVHEIAPILGILDIYASEEIANFEQSKSKPQLGRLHEMLRALDRLSQSAAAPVFAEFDLAATVQSVCEAETMGRNATAELAGPTPLVVLGDKGLFELALANGLRNAIEAVEDCHKGSDDIPPVVITWGETDSEVWVAVLDRGAGPPVTVDRAFEIGSTTKKNHLGMGLATARQALLSLSGAVTLVMRTETGGARFELRWPRVGIGS